jgi:hypothetical protein
MKSFLASALAGSAFAQFGTTGHVGNGFAHKGTKDHSPQDHTYGYDSVPVDFDIVEASNAAISILIKDKVAMANDERLDYLLKIFNKRKQRLSEIHADNLTKLAAPFQYQTRLLQDEENDILRARNNAVRDSNDAYDDLIFRLESFAEDINFGFDDELAYLNNALQRAVIDHKQVCQVLLAFRLDWVDSINCDPSWIGIGAAPATPAQVLAPVYDWKEYNNIFSDFHYDIGHGKGLGEGSINSAPVTDGFRSGNLAAAPRGDRQTQIGAPTIAWERPGRSDKRRF